MEHTNSQAGKRPKRSNLVDVSKLIDAYYTAIPDPRIPEQRVAFGTSGHRGSSFKIAFNEWHILAITQAICDYRRENGIDGPLFVGMDTHALSQSAYVTALEVLGGNGVQIMIAQNDDYTPTPVISHAILTYNRGRKKHFADGIVITPSHNPPEEGGFKYDPPNGGGAGPNVTNWIETRANELLVNKLNGVKRIALDAVLNAETTRRHDYLHTYIEDLKNVVDMDLISESKICIGIDPLGGAGIHYWGPIAEHYHLNLHVVNETIDPTFSFMTLDWDGRIRMDPSSPYAMQRLLTLKNRFKVAAGCDPDHDRHGIVTPDGLLSPNQYFAAAIDYLLHHRPHWGSSAMIGKTIVTSQLLDRVAQRCQRKIYETPVGFKWFVDKLFDGTLAFAGEESAGAVFARFDGSTWTTDKDGIVMAMLAAEMTARLNQDPGETYHHLTQELGEPFNGMIEQKATQKQKEILKNLSSEQISSQDLAGEKIQSVLTRAPGNDAPIGGVKVISQNGWFAARPSGTEDILKIYAESFLGEDHLHRLLDEAQTLVKRVLDETH